MNREIKFRAFQDNQMLYSPISSNYGLAKFFGTLYEDAKIMQYIGLKDKNGKEIYEGDVLRLDVTFVNAHVFSDDETKDITHRGTFKVYYNSKVAAFDLELIESSTDTQGWCLMEDTKDEMEIIGNIHEHPHLLQEVKP